MRNEKVGPSQQVEVDICALPAPEETSDLERLLDRVDANEVVAVIGKVDGSGGAVDLSRQVASARIQRVLAERRDVGGRSSHQDPRILLSSGCAGLISPHLTIVRRTFGARARTGGSTATLAVGVASSEVITPVEIGRTAQVGKVEQAVRRAIADAAVVLESIACVLVKAPSVSPRDAARLAGRTCGGAAESMAYSNDASALGVALALGGVDRSAITDEVIRRDWSLSSPVTVASAGPELERASVVVLGNSLSSTSSLRIGRSIITDPLDAEAAVRAYTDATGRPFDPLSSPRDIIQVFAKLILPVTDEVRGRQTSFDLEPAPATIAKAIGAAHIGAVVGHSAVFVSGGERGSHQGVGGGGPISMIVRSD